MALYNRDCELCPLHKTEGVTCISGAGNIKNPRIMVVGDAPSKQEAPWGHTFLDKRGQLIQQALKETGFNTGKDGDIFATYACKCFPSGKVKITDARTCADEYLLKEILLFKPELILALGRTPQIVLMRNTSPIAKTHGKIFEHTFKLNDQEFTTKVMPLEHPFSVLTEPTKLDMWLADIKRAKMVFDSKGDPYWNPSKIERFNFEVIESIEHFKAVARKLTKERGSYLSIDIEASGIDEDMFREDFRVYTLQFGVTSLTDQTANDTLPVYIVPIQSSQFEICSDPTWLPAVREMLNQFLSLRYFRLVAHNGKYDAKGLRRVGVNCYIDRDTMLLWSNLHGEAPMSLKEIAYQVSDLGGYEKEMQDYFAEHGSYDAPRDLLVTYGGLDIVVTRRLMYEMHHSILQEIRS